MGNEKENEPELRATLGRALLLAGALGLLLTVLRGPIARWSFGLLGDGEPLQALAAGDIGVRIWSLERRDARVQSGPEGLPQPR